LIGHIMQVSGREAEIGGNLGIPVLELEPLVQDETYVLEMSSFQLELTRSITFDVAVLLNISPDHQDRYAGMDDYIAAKKQIFHRQTAPRTAIVGVDDDFSRAIYEELKTADEQVVIGISGAERVHGGVYAVNGVLVDDTEGQETPVMDLGENPSLPGQHNWQNAAAAYAAAKSAGVSPHAAMACIQSYPGLVHRQEPVALVDGIGYVNDSKATNAEAAAQALRSFERIIWIAGGRAKEGGISSLQELFPKIETAFLIGEAADDFAATLEGRVSCEIVETLEAATSAAAEQALAMDTDTVVLLSPAAASFDQFKDFEARGERFRELVLGLAALHASGARAEGQA